MELTSDYPFWSIRNGLPKSYPSLRRDVTCDAVVVGGGITGAMAAYYLAEAGVHSVLLDKRDIGTGSTSGSTALLQYEVDVPLRTLTKKIGAAKASRSYQLCYETIGQIEKLAKKLKLDCGFEKKPSLFVARKTEEIPELREELRLRRKLGFDVEFWDQTDVERNFPFSRPAALFSENGGQVDPHRLTHGLLKAASERGLQVFDRTAVRHFEPTSRGIKLTTQDGFIVNARRAVIAAGFESLNYVKGEAGRLKSTYALISEPIAELSGWHRRSLIWESGMPYLYLRTTPDNRVIVGGEDVAVVNPTLRDVLIPHKTKILVRKFKEMFPSVDLEVAYSWAGTFGETKDGLAYIGGNRGLPHAYFALGYGGNGITYSLIAAKLIRDNFLGRRNPDAKLFRFER
jgi:glycine/D-amino acid oxidase-like deaminating enzyme